MKDSKLSIEDIERMEDKKDVEGLIKALRYEGDWKVRSEAACALGLVEDRRAVEPLIQALNDEDHRIQEEVVYALGCLKDARAVEPLIKLLDQEEGEARDTVVWALGEIGNKKALEAVLEALDDWDENVKEKAAEIIRERRERETLETLAKGLEEANCELEEELPTESEVVKVFPLRRKRSDFTLPIEVELDMENEWLSLYCDLDFGLVDVGRKRSVKGIANYFRRHADMMEEEEEKILKLGFELHDNFVDGIHYLRFRFAKDYSLDEVDKLVKDVKNLLEEISLEERLLIRG